MVIKMFDSNQLLSSADFLPILRITKIVLSGLCDKFDLIFSNLISFLSVCVQNRFLVFN